MTHKNPISSYLCMVVGETPERVSKFHISTIKRTKAFALAIHIPVLLWAMSGYLIAAEIFGQTDAMAAAIAAMCAGLIYLVERLVLATPKGFLVSLSRILIGFVIAILGASTVDLIVFEREITEQLNKTGEVKLVVEHDKKISAQSSEVAQKKALWLSAQEAANCEANGTCGSNIRSVGPVYRALARQAELLRVEYMSAQAQLDSMKVAKDQALNAWRNQPQDASTYGILSRVQALHAYTSENTAALVAWLMFFVLVLFLELMVVFSKLVFAETVDDELDAIREQISQRKAREYQEAVTAPLASAQNLVQASYS